MSQTAVKTNLLGMSLPMLQAYFEAMGEKPFRAVQVMKWMHQRGVMDFSAMTDISHSLQQKLLVEAEVRPPIIVEEFLAADGCYKWIVEVASGSRVETVFIPEDDRGTLCISSQAGCTLDCSFCATGKQGFNSNLTAAEIIGQLWWANHRLGGFAPARPHAGKTIRSVSNVVMMGMGEPLLNFDNVMASLSLMMDDNAYGLSKRRVTISTAGVVPAIDKLRLHTDASLAVSLHAPNDELRNQIVPINRKYPIKELLRSVADYIDSLPDKRVPVIEYTLISGVNDQKQHAQELAALLRDFPCKINLIPFNPFSQSDYRRPSNNAISNFRQILQEARFTVTVRTTRGDDIGAACGQLVGEVVDQTRRSERYRRASTEAGNPEKGNFRVFTSADNLAVSVDSARRV
jgi:23S rRNA (adenine2503-C2)-methyltransferase